MYTEHAVKSRLNEFLNHSIAQDPEWETQYRSIMTPLEDAVTAYFTSCHPKLEPTLEELVHNLYCDQVERLTVNERTYGKPFPTDFPETYSDIRKCFYKFVWLDTTDEDFYSAWIISSATEENPLIEPIGHTMIETWVSEVEAAHTSDYNAVMSLLGWVQNSASTNHLPNLLEDTGLVLESPTTLQIAKEIYQTKGLLEIIQSHRLQVYIPSYFGSDVVKFAGTRPSVQAMEDDESIPVDKYVLISSNDEDDGNLYIRTETEYRFVANIKGTAGAVFTPHVNPNTHYLSWTNNGGLPNPDPVYIRGAKGEKGDVGSVDRITESFINNLF